ncbi:hypothetical protein L3X38_027963 [Prunus dulcis]|uniref:Uncharacterized protein n=1 Tax=Prunus dulcis TaxID=3755 RepID=A0AAD4Z0R8_PRUDU|nr:hypothetical protein L3X38_027963 [Prunus dulcis]
MHLKHFRSIMILYKGDDSLMCKETFRENESLLPEIVDRPERQVLLVLEPPDQLIDLVIKICLTAWIGGREL